MTEREPFRTRIKVRHYELDTLGHLNHAVYHSYGEVARLELLEAAGGLAGFTAEKLAAVLLETHVVFRRELRAGDVVDVTCDVKFGSGKTFRMDSNIVKVDGTPAAEITCTLGLMDLERRKLVEDPRARFEAAGADLKLLSTAE
ncbi:acyl-CoA thioesterase [Amycolatopsis australiensis]|uniref:Acyl-CoA thioester hydrolase n=1 Tax=Amycolatopsis australiensis TaxID=546364 RepID=A0A1K1T741_9PSEU|nr:acyl-CoA thioesterase [Amycolatopsis australiensis]SFW92384.1 acyl-CoA thioester hydrolase [Amycolatopsis australiensis]